MLVKQRDNEIGILLNYLNKQKEAAGSGASADTSIPVDSFGGGPQHNNMTHNGVINTSASTAAEETKQPTLFQMMGGRGGAASNQASAAMANRSIKEKRMDFELN